MFFFSLIRGEGNSLKRLGERAGEGRGFGTVGGRGPESGRRGLLRGRADGGPAGRSSAPRGATEGSRARIAVLGRAGERRRRAARARLFAFGGRGARHFTGKGDGRRTLRGRLASADGRPSGAKQTARPNKADGRRQPRRAARPKARARATRPEDHQPARGHHHPRSLPAII